MGQRRRHTSKRPPQDKKAEPRAPWELSCDRDRVWVMPCDADHALVYWELTGASVATARANLERISPEVQLVLRVRCNGRTSPAGPGARTYDIPIDDWVGQRYVLLGPGGCDHFCAVGLRTLNSDEGVFTALARSGWVRAPRRA
ncbi:MAG: hypothetical protein CMH57_02140 [Myxococcales bacterium]|nr:hypothetical protein [Myxococcales bacterium]